ncbi:zinc finger C-x8-C-x5-C-x3-H type family protein [Striga asiatica]|uniref:Zinc finger C-x8-C-x5-C-x3-H type family protein n=1 Tax=Striga asiatica TaxID=4170 RepID=A0A5A7Q4Z7_STRAF|nr:zinc finger C-x8-C-x5-C-x3-H type family protein [Striga asiatica]
MMVLPGTLSAFQRLRGKGIADEQLSLPVNNSLPHQGVRVELFEDDNGYEIGSSHKQQHSNVYAVEEKSDPIVAETNDQILMQDRHIDQPMLEKKRRTRGPTMCKDVHAWTLDERRPIFFNVKGQPIGPDQETLTKFSMFLGTISRDSTLAPLNKVDWRHVTGKDKIFDYRLHTIIPLLQKKFIIPEEAMEYVLSSVGDLWRSHKCRIKKKHYTGYENDKERWMNRPKSISGSHFKELLEYWKLDEVKENAEKKVPDQALMYKETRKRKEGKTYMSSYEETVPDSLKSELLGRYTKKRKQSLNCGSGGVLISDEIMQPYRAGILKETVAEVMKLLKDQIPSKILSTIASSLKTQSFEGIKETGHCQDDIFDDDGANDYDKTIHENAERIENEEGEEGGEEEID